MAPTLTLMVSEYPIADIRSAHQFSGEARQEKLAGILEIAAGRHYVACHRNGYEVSVATISEAEYHWCQLLQTHSLGEALGLIDTTAFSFEQWLLNSVKNNLIFQLSLI